MSMYQLNQIPSEAQIKKTIRMCVFGSNMHCPGCKSRQITTYQNRYRCRKCRTRFSLLSHTWLANLKLPLAQFWLVLWCWMAQVPVKQTARLTKLSVPTIRHWFAVFRPKLPDDTDTLDSLVQLDEAYFGSKSKNTLRALFMGKQMDSRKLAYKIINKPYPVREDAWDFLKEKVKPQTQIATDGAKIYRGMDKWWPVTHSYDLHRKFEFEQTSEIEGIFGVLRTFIRRMYHHVSCDKLPELVREFCCRFSHPEMFENPCHYLLITLRLVPTR